MWKRKVAEERSESWVGSVERERENGREGRWGPQTNEERRVIGRKVGRRAGEGQVDEECEGSWRQESEREEVRQ